MFSSSPLPHVNFVNIVTLSKQSWVNIEQRRGGLNILYPLLSQDIPVCVISVCLDYFCP